MLTHRFRLFIALFALLLLSATTLHTQPAWRPYVTLGTARLFHNALYIGNNQVLVIGGLTNTSGSPTGTTSCEIINVGTGTVAPTGSTDQPHAEFVALLTPDSNIVVVSGLSGGQEYGPLTGEVELYNRSTGTWRVIGNLRTARRQHIAIFINDHEILVVGGLHQNHAAMADAEIFDINTGLSRPAASFPFPINCASIGYASNGELLVLGGRDGGANSGRRAFVYRYNITNNRWDQVAQLATPLQGTQMLKLRDGRLMISGGSRWESPPDFAREVQVEEGGVWRVMGMMQTERQWSAMGQWSDDSILTAGGYDNTTEIGTTCDWVNLRTGTITPGPAMNTPHSYFPIVAVPWCPDMQGRPRNSALLAIGGRDRWDAGTASVEILALCPISPPDTTNDTIPDIVFDPGPVEYTYYATSACPGLHSTLQVPFNSNRYTDTITGISFAGPYARFFEYGGATPITIPIRPSSDQRIPVRVRWPAVKTRSVCLMILTTSANDTFRIAINGAAPMLTFGVLNIKAIHLGTHSGTFDTCVTVTNKTARTIRFTDSSWFRGVGGTAAMTSPGFPIVLQPYGEATLCFEAREISSTMSDTLMLGGMEIWECPHCALATIRVDGSPQGVIADVISRTSEQANGAVTLGPNPAREELGVDVQLEQSSTLEVRIFSIDGGEQFALPRQRYAAGGHHFSIDVTGWEAGSYWVYLEGEKINAARRFVVVH